MTSDKRFYWGMVAGLLLGVAAQAGNWLITPLSHPDASEGRHAGVIVQGVLCLAATLWLVVRERAHRSISPVD